MQYKTSFPDKSPSVLYVHDEKDLKIEMTNCQDTNDKSNTF